MNTKQRRKGRGGGRLEEGTGFLHPAEHLLGSERGGVTVWGAGGGVRSWARCSGAPGTAAEEPPAEGLSEGLPEALADMASLGHWGPGRTASVGRSDCGRFSPAEAPGQL